MRGHHPSDGDIKRGNGGSQSWLGVRPTGSWPTLAAVERAGIEAVAYADVFDYPLTALELHRYLPGIQATPETIRVALHRGRLAARCLNYSGGYFTLSGRGELINLRRRRAAVAARRWCQAERYALRPLQWEKGLEQPERLEGEHGSALAPTTYCSLTCSARSRMF